MRTVPGTLRGTLTMPGASLRFTFRATSAGRGTWIRIQSPMEGRVRTPGIVESLE